MKDPVRVPQQDNGKFYDRHNIVRYWLKNKHALKDDKIASYHEENGFFTKQDMENIEKECEEDLGSAEQRIQIRNWRKAQGYGIKVSYSAPRQ